MAARIGPLFGADTGLVVMSVALVLNLVLGLGLPASVVVGIFKVELFGALTATSDEWGRKVRRVSKMAKGPRLTGASWSYCAIAKY